MARRYLRRYTDATRMNHWFIALMFFAAALSGLAFFHPALYPLSALFGGGPWTRILHPFLGLLMVAGFAWMFLRMWRDNVFVAVDREWVDNVPQMLRGDDSRHPPVGKYNAGQKAVFWIFGVSLLLLLITGFMFWSPWFVHFFPVVLRRIAVVVHAIAAVVLVLSVIVHVYAAIWVKGTFRAMTRGTVPESWARFHHPLWHRKLTQGDR